tara:strand:+ start:28278 stop:28919 length:642 start_codon:yes stop_codon:yes gene_type:complete
MELNDKYPEIIYKVAIIGESYTGKSSLLNRYIKKSFNNSFVSTIGVDFFIKNLMINNKLVKIQLWDTAGQEQYANLIKSYFTNCTVALIVYDITNRSTFNKVDYWLKTFKMNYNEDRPCVLIGTKCDLERDREVSQIEGYAKASNLDMDFIECSSKNNINIDDIFENLSKKIVDLIENEGFIPTKVNGLKITNKYHPMYIDEKREEVKCCTIS